VGGLLLHAKCFYMSINIPNSKVKRCAAEQLLLLSGQHSMEALSNKDSRP
jgi:hypothetical protein